MSCGCNDYNHSNSLGALMGFYGLGDVGLTAGSRVVFTADFYAGLFSIDDVIARFRQYLRQRGLQVEDITSDDGQIEWGAQGLRYRVYAQVVTPIDRRQVDDLTGNMVEDLARASGKPVTNGNLSIIAWGVKDTSGNPLPLPGAPDNPNNDADDDKSLWDELAKTLNVKKEQAKLIGIGGAALFLVLLLKR